MGWIKQIANRIKDLILFDSADATKYNPLWTSPPAGFAVYESSGAVNRTCTTISAAQPKFKRIRVSFWHRNEFSGNSGGSIRLINNNGGVIRTLVSWGNDTSGTSVDQTYDISNITVPFKVQLYVYCDRQSNLNDSRCYLGNCTLYKD